MNTIFKPGKNCWGVFGFSRGAFLYDGQEYFSALRKAFLSAKHSIFILGWDINSQTRLEPEDDKSTLGNILNESLRKNKDLQVYILIWDYYTLIGLDREFFGKFKFMAKMPERIHYIMDNAHPVGASHHEKIILIDDNICFTGGFDIAASRWDTRQHQPDDKRRIDPNGKHYEPYHDVQVLLQGEIVDKFSEHVRARWGRATTNIKPVEPNRKKMAFDNLPWNFSSGKAAICRTIPPFRDFPGVTEISEIYKDLIMSAQNTVYLENQYFTSHELAEFFVKKLQEDSSVEFALVVSEHSTGWFEEEAMFRAREDVIEFVKKNDQKKRFRILCPKIKNHDEILLKVHSKLMVVDEKYLLVGSANLTNRSFSMDTELCVVFDAMSVPEFKNEIAVFRSNLLAEHLGVKVTDVPVVFEPGRSLNDFIEKYNHTENRYFKDLKLPQKNRRKSFLKNFEMADIKRPLYLDLIMDALNKSFFDSKKIFFAGPLMIGLIVGLLLFFAILIRFTPLGEFLNSETIMSSTNFLTEISDNWILYAYVFGALLFVPVNLLIIVSAILFPLDQAIVLTFVGLFLNFTVGYLVGFLFGFKKIKKIFTFKIVHIVKRFREKEFMAIFLVRMLPVVPNSLVNLVGGAIHLSYFRFVAASWLGVMPGALMLILFVKSLLGLFQDPSFFDWLFFVVLLLFFGGLMAYFFRRVLR